MADNVELIDSHFSKLFKVLCSSFHPLLVISKAHDTYAVVHRHLRAKRDREAQQF